ncbi:hypothetical protein P7K49_000310 [Saguinus oedipus]|uniref:IF rod domain-containing protein n=1 Tax=Saguinus oedipus TaxID=9490 RepID=A0ABQ9WBB7_SAGOE|nr:hypothetical protein P7K49_000310 [Saguinus oedipus]
MKGLGALPVTPFLSSIAPTEAAGPAPSQHHELWLGALTVLLFLLPQSVGDSSPLSVPLRISGAGRFRSQSVSRCIVASWINCSSATSLGLCLGLAHRRPPASDTLHLSQATALTNEYKISCTNEEQLQALNNRFTVFIEGKLAFERLVYREEVAKLLATLQASSQAAAEVDVAVAKPDLSLVLRKICAHYKFKSANLKKQVARSTKAVQASREEIHEYRCQLQACTIEIEGLCRAKESLERDILELEERHSAEMAGYQDSTGQLENDLRNTKSEMAHHLREYQDIFNVKMTLDIEVAAYRKLLEGEETRFSTSGLNILGLNPLPNPSFLLPPRILSSTTSKVSSSGLSLKKQEKEASKVASKKTSQIGESFEEMLEETVISTKKTEKSNIE